LGPATGLAMLRCATFATVARLHPIAAWTADHGEMVSIGTLFAFALVCAEVVFLPWETWLRLIVWLAIGLVLYFAYGRSHSVLMNGEKR
jgi:hypothetical protein